MLPLSERILQANSTLAPFAVPHEGRRGRKVKEPDDETRFPFQRDRDRILQTTAFRRLQGKTQVFVSGEGDHFRTRLTHSMEVAQIARDIARALRLNEDLAECIALAHDLGHPPFGHRGEAALDSWMRRHGSAFEHNIQSYRIVTLVEKRSSLYTGLNLNYEVEEGLLKHETVHPSEGHALEPALEAEVTNLADEIAYTSHDCDDGLMADLFSLKDLIKIPLAKEAYDRSKTRGTYLRGSIVHILVKDLLETSMPLLRNPSGTPRITFSAQTRQNINELRHFLASKMYDHPRVRDKAVEGQQIIQLLCDHYFEHPNDKITGIEQRTGGSRIIAIKDYVAGMTDSFAWLQAAELGLLPVAESLYETLPE
jgi:dGTPase